MDSCLKINRRELAGALLALVGTQGRLTAETAAPVAKTAYGKIRGAQIDGINVFKGVLYGGPTEGAARFLPPTKPEKWTGIRDTIETGPRCVQGAGNLFDSVIGDYFSGGRKEQLGLGQQKDSENCLVLNVLTTALHSSNKLPVMVYIHGGGYTSGSGVIALAAEAFPREEQIVLVSVNHRLNVFGYLYLGEFNSAYADSGNAGMLDLVAALQWVRDNIAEFGGDPGNVTIFGESGGGGKVSALMAMPAAQGLFHRAIVESGSTLRASTKEAAVERAKAVLKNLGIDEGQCDRLRSVPASELFAAARQVAGGGGPVVDGRSIPLQTWDPAAPSVSAGVPMIIGNCKDESAWLIGNREPSTFNLDEAAMRARVAKLPDMPGAAVDELIAIYYRAHPNATPSDIFFEIASDKTFGNNATTQVERKTRQGSAPVFKYYFAYNTPIQDGRYRAFHTAELPLVLRLVRYPESDRLSRQLSGAWASFARNGNPNHDGLPPWPAYNLETRPTMVFDAKNTIKLDDPGKEKRLEWRRLAKSNG